MYSRIFAQFATLDDADHAAREIKRKIPDVKDLRVSGHHSKHEEPRAVGMQTIPLMTSAPAAIGAINHDYLDSSPSDLNSTFEPDKNFEKAMSLKIESDYTEKAESVLISLGGRNIKIVDVP